MANSAKQKPQAVDADVACAKCGYNLRGLAGEMVTCPECGSRYHTCMLAGGNPGLPWWGAPRLRGYLLLAVIFSIAYGCFVLYFIASGTPGRQPEPLLLITAPCLLIFLVGAVKVSKGLPVSVAAGQLILTVVLAMTLVVVLLLSLMPVVVMNNTGFLVLSPPWLVVKSLLCIPIIAAAAGALLMIRLIAHRCRKRCFVEQALIADSSASRTVAESVTAQRAQR